MGIVADGRTEFTLVIVSSIKFSLEVVHSTWNDKSMELVSTSKPVS